MKILLSWLQEYVPLRVEPRQLAADLCMLGLPVDSVSTADGETVLELDITTNRPDWLSHYGVARELAAYYELPLAPMARGGEPSEKPRARGRRKEAFVEVEAKDACARYSARIIRGVQVQPSPAWLSRRLELVGVRSINNVADATNYVLMAYGHPLHAFDLNRLEGGVILVRRAREGELLVTLDGVERKLSSEDLVIADARRPVALAGIMGGRDTEISNHTQNVLLESAWFDPVGVRRTAKRHGLHTEASHRFERGADVEATLTAADRCAELIQELAGGEIDPEATDVYPRPRAPMTVGLRRWEIARHLGTEIPAEEVERILFRLNFAPRVKGRMGWTCRAPSYRVDVSREIDLIEEIARLYGYDRFPMTLPEATGQPSHRPEHAAMEERLRGLLLGLGYDETISHALVGRETESFGALRAVALANPLSEEASVLRTSLLPGLLSALEWNAHRGQETVRLFEMGQVYGTEGEGPREMPALGLVASGEREPGAVGRPGREYDFFDLKGDVEQILEGFETRSVEFESTELAPYYRKGHAARVVVNGVPVGQFGQLDPGRAERRKFRRPVFLGELHLEPLRQMKLRGPAVRSPSRYPAVERDFSIVLREGTPYEAVRRCVESLAIPEVQTVRPVETFRGAPVPGGHYSLLLRVTLQSESGTLTEAELGKIGQRIMEAVERQLGARIRAGN